MSDKKQCEYRLKQIEDLAGLGFWEWNPDKDQLYLSQGLKNTFNFIDSDNVVKKLIDYLRKTKQYYSCQQLIILFRLLKKGHFIQTQTIQINYNNTKLFYEIKIKQLGEFPKVLFSGIVQNITEKYQYSQLKEKEIRFEKQVTQIASRFLKESNFKDDVNLTLSEVGNILSASQVKVIQIENNTSKEKYFWRNQNIKQAKNSFISNLPPSEIKYFIELLKEKKIIYINQASDVPECATVAKEYFKKSQSTSILLASIVINNQTIGALLLTRHGEFNKWDFADIHMVKMTSLIISNALKQNNIQKALKKSERRLQFALLAGNLGTWEYNIKQNSFYFDEKYANLFGYSNNIINKIPDWLKKNIHTQDINLYNNALEKCLHNKQKYYAIELRIKCKDNSYKWVNDWGLTTVFDEEGNPEKMVGVVQDITSRKEIENELIIAKENAEKSEKLKTTFLANVSHEIRTPMNGITGFAEMLYHNSVSEKEKHQYLELIWKNSNRLLELINNILDVSRLETNQIQLFEREYNLIEIFNEVKEKYTKKISKNKNINFIFTNFFTDKQSAYIKVDALRLKQILKHLIDNALKFTNQGFIEVNYKLNDKGLLEFCVKDTGSGIDEKQFNSIFKRFAQTERAYNLNKGGSGLGLPITKGLIDLMGGSIWFHSTKSVGSSFYFNIPYKPSRLAVKNLE